MPLKSHCPISQSAMMFAKFQNAFDKIGLFLQDGGRSIEFRRHMSMTRRSCKVQSIYDLCKTTFTPSGNPPISSQNIEKLCSLLDAVGLSDVSLKEENSEDDDRGYGLLGLHNLNRAARWAKPITYLDMYECASFTMCMFCFPSSSVIPLHDHPAMTVFSKVLYGSLHVKAYDWVEPACFLESKTSARLAKLAVDKVLTSSCGTSVLYPKTGGNLHCFTAITPCAVLDILSPPYREDAGRKCTYYHDYPYSTFSPGSENGAGQIVGKEEDHAWLIEINPDDLYMRQVTAGKISRRVSLVHYPDAKELEKANSSNMKKMHKKSSGFSFTTSSHQFTTPTQSSAKRRPHAVSQQTSSTRSNKQKSSLSEIGEPSNSAVSVNQSSKKSSENQLKALSEAVVR